MKHRKFNPCIYDVSSAYKLDLPTVGNQSVAIFDIDNTLLHPSDGDLGSDQWFDALFTLISPYKNYPEVYKQLVQLILDLYFHVQQHIRVKPVEEAMIIYFNLLQALNVRIILVTSRGVNLAERTVQQLKDIGLEFNLGNKKKKLVPLGKGNKDQPPVYLNGIIYCSGNNKGNCFKKFLETLKAPAFFYVIDDKLQNISDIFNALKGESNSNCIGYRYGYLDDHVKKFNLDITHEQISFLASKDGKIAELYHQLEKVIHYKINTSVSSWQPTLFYTDSKIPEAPLKVLAKEEQSEIKKII